MNIEYFLEAANKNFYFFLAGVVVLVVNFFVVKNRRTAKACSQRVLMAKKQLQIYCRLIHLVNYVYPKLPQYNSREYMLFINKMNCVLSSHPVYVYSELLTCFNLLKREDKKMETFCKKTQRKKEKHYKEFVKQLNYEYATSPISGAGRLNQAADSILR